MDHLKQIPAEKDCVLLATGRYIGALLSIHRFRNLALFATVFTISSMNLLFDSWCSQMLFQQEPPSYPKGVSNGKGAPLVTGMRLNTLLGAIKSIGLSSRAPWNVSFTQPPIDAAQLSGIQVYISLTRYKTPPFAYTSDELGYILDWVNHGGNVLLMTNHGGFPNNRPDNWTANDAALAGLFGIKLEDHSVQDFTSSGADRSILLQVQDTIPYLAGEAPKIMAHDSCLIVPPSTNFVSVVEFPSDRIRSKHKSVTALPATGLSLLFDTGSGTSTRQPRRKRLAQATRRHPPLRRA
jgi:hypothetical protein